MQKELIGVIVPVYKVEKYIAECIESILAQTYAKFRLILVDDGTPDGAGKICDEYAKKDPRITVIHQENTGVTQARAHGVEEAADCEFITFVDSDDTIATGFLEEFYKAMHNDVDIVINESNLPIGNLPMEEYLECLFTGKYGVKLAPWCRLFRRSLFSDKTFDIPRDIVVGEDMLMNIRLAFSSSKEQIAVIDNAGLYNYRENEGGISCSFKGSPEYEHLFQQSLKQSIPQGKDAKYFDFTIKNRLKNFHRFYGKKYKVKGMKETAFYQELKSDMEQYGYRLPAAERMLFNNDNPVIRFFALIARGMMKPFYKK